MIKIYNSRWSNDLTKLFTEKTIFGTIKLGSNYYQYIVSGGILDGSYYTLNGYIPPDEMAMVVFMRNVGKNNETVFFISYYESMDSINKKIHRKSISEFEELMGFEPGWNTPQAEADAFNTNKEEWIANYVLECAKEAMQILDIEDEEIQTLTDADNKINSNTEKLIAIKKLKDTGVISNEDYENKKKQLLESL